MFVRSLCAYKFHTAHCHDEPSGRMEDEEDEDATRVEDDVPESALGGLVPG